MKSNDFQQQVPDWLEFERQHVWHPYASMVNPAPVIAVDRAEGCYLHLHDGRKVLDGMASWWCAIHGYQVPELNSAIEQQLQSMAHVMFGGLTHEPAARLARQLIEITPPSLQHVFFADSGSVSVEVAIKMAIQYWQAQQQCSKNRLLTIRHGYHGDTLAAMAVTDPVNGMHHLFSSILPTHYFADAPVSATDADYQASEIDSFHQIIRSEHGNIAAVILEPIVQGAGGMRVYAPEFLRQVKALCQQYDVLLIVDEVATGFARTGRMFAVEHAGIEPDIMCVGKALTGGYMSLAAVLCNARVCEGLHGEGQHAAGVLMHGPTFMANPLACAVASASIELLCSSPWQARVQAIEAQLEAELDACRQSAAVADVRVFGAIGVLELRQPIDVNTMQNRLLQRGVWLRPFGKLLYTMPPYVMSSEQLSVLTRAMCDVVKVD